ncbi:hypothetical protein SRABI106_01485 [Rahnella aquatilis]|nr:hypothetical protein SRABI106_01485 [Rahnella aquatilis]
MTNFNTGGVGWDQRTGNAQIRFVAEQVIGIFQFKCQAQHGGDRCQRDVTLVPGQAHAKHFLTLPLAFTHDTKVRDGTGIRTRFRAGQGETGNFQTFGQTRQIVIFLLRGAVMLQ